MKFVHIADIHLDTPFTLLSQKGDFGTIRRLDQRNALKTMIEYIKQNQIPYLFIAGDLYEHNYIKKSTIEYINDLFKTIPQTNIYITPGNHDPYIKNSMYESFEWSQNVKIFTSKIEKVEMPQVDIYGVGFDDFYCQDLGIEDIQIQNKNKINILVTHGSLNASDKMQLQYNPISKSKLQNIGFDYVALGHIHKLDYNQEPNQNIVYPGSTISMGFDELGQHGFIEGNLQKGEVKLQFIPVDTKQFEELELDITNQKDQEELIETLNHLSLKENNLYKIILTGIRNFEIEINDIYKLITNSNIIKIKNKTKLNYALEQMQNNYTLKGIFIKQIMQEMQDNNYTQEELEQILEMGLSVLE